MRLITYSIVLYCYYELLTEPFVLILLLLLNCSVSICNKRAAGAEVTKGEIFSGFSVIEQ